MPDGQQLVLPFAHQPGLRAIDLLAHAGIAAALEFLAATSAWPLRRLSLWGPHASGKTHLLHVWAAERGASLIAGPDLTEPVWPEGPVAVDDVDKVASEAALLHLANAAQEAKWPLLLASMRPPGRLPVRLPDLASRLRATTAVELCAADEPFLAQLLARLLADRQLVVKHEVQQYLLTRLPRTPAALRAAVTRLDDAALAAKAEITRPFVAHILADWFGAPPEETRRG